MLYWGVYSLYIYYDHCLITYTHIHTSCQPCIFLCLLCKQISKLIVENKRPTWCHSLFLFHFLCVQHVSDINISIIRSLQLFCWITTWVMCSWFDVCWCFGVVGLAWYLFSRLKHHWSVHVEFHMNRPVVLQPATRITLQPNQTKTRTHDQCGNSTE